MQKYWLLTVAILVICCSFTDCNSGQSKGPDVSKTESVRTVLKGLNIPWEILWGKDDHIWMTERKGKISKVDPATGRVVFSASVAEVVNNNEGGMLGMVQHPGFLTNGLFMWCTIMNPAVAIVRKWCR